MNATTLTAHRIAESGPSAASDTEILTLLVGQSAAEALVAEYGSLAEVGRMGPDDLELAGLTATKAALLVAALEAGRRSLAPIERPRLLRGEEVAAYYRPRLATLQHEVFRVACLDTRNHLIRDAQVAQGGIASCAILPREIFAPAIRAGSTGVVMVHNHPSGDPEPSADDLHLTARLCRAGEVLGIRVLDHVVIAAGGFVSLSERGHMR